MSNIVFFLGSGFSKAIADIPVQKEFLKKILEKCYEGKTWRSIIYNGPRKSDSMLSYS